MITVDEDVAKVRAAVGTAIHTLDGTSAAFERILVEMGELRRKIEASEAILNDHRDVTDRMWCSE